MISIILYGRNDNHGYNLHKRAALSLNCMAEVLTHDDDEILFVDYNTPDDFPTFPEAIGDTLTAKARGLLRVLRVRASVHEERYAHLTHLKTVEPVARNVAVRRSNPNNPWILTSNTDMIFVPKVMPKGSKSGQESLSDLVQALTPGLYCAPRFEIPETLWENFNRLDPVAVIADLRATGRQLHLDEIVLGSDDIRYDAPGDFQLMPRDELFAIDAFDESMLLGWHIDSNISKRLRLKLGEVKDAEHFVSGYHCDHTRQVTLMHRHGTQTNCTQTYIDEVISAPLPAQRGTWGLAEHWIEEIRLGHFSGGPSGSQRFRQTLEQMLPQPCLTPRRVAYRNDSFDQAPANAAHIIPFLLDMFATAPRDTKLAWLGMAGELFDLFQRCWETHGFTAAIDLIECPNRQATAMHAAQGFVMNFGVPETCAGKQQHQVLRSYWALVELECQRMDLGLTPRRVVTVNAIHNRFESLVLGMVNCTKTPFSTRLRHGYVRTDVFNYPASWLEKMHIGAAGTREGKLIRASGKAGHVMYGPYTPILNGTYDFEISLEVLKSDTLLAIRCIEVTVEVVADEIATTLKRFNLRTGSHVLPVKQVTLNHDTPPMLQLRLHSDGRRTIVIDAVTVTRSKPRHDAVRVDKAT